MTRSGRHFLQIPGPTNVPDRVLRAMAAPVIDHRGPEFAPLGHAVLEGMRAIFQTTSPVIIYPSSGTGACEAALSNPLSPGDRVVIMETGWFSHVAWRQVAERLGLVVDYVPGTWRRGASPDDLEARLAPDRQHDIKAVVVVHNETSTGATSRLPDLRAVMNRLRHPALLIVDTVSSLASIDYRHDEWEVDVAVSGSQKGLMVPPGLGFNAVSEKALKASSAKHTKSTSTYWDWHEMIRRQRLRILPVHAGDEPPLRAARGVGDAAGRRSRERLLPARPPRRGDPRRSPRVGPRDPLRRNHASTRMSLTAVLMPDGHDADALREGDPRSLRHVARHRSGQAGRRGVPHRASRKLQRPDAGRHAERSGDGPGGGRSAAPAGGVTAALAHLAQSA